MATITDNDLALFRERAKTELESTGDIGRIAWDCVVEELCKEVARLRSGDCAKLREALVPFPSLCEWLVENAAKLGIPDMVAKLRERGDKARAALSAPPRNCDRFATVDEAHKRERNRNFHRFATADEAAEAWHKHEANDTGEEYCAECPFNLGEECARGSVCTIGWLYAEAQEGGANG